MCCPLTNRNLVLKEQFDLKIGPPRRFADAKPNVQQCYYGGTRVHESKHGAQFSVVVHVRRRERNDPDGEEEAHDGA